MNKNSSRLSIGMIWAIEMALAVILIPCFAAGLVLTVILSPAILTLCFLYVSTMCFKRFLRIASNNIAYFVNSGKI